MVIISMTTIHCLVFSRVFVHYFTRLNLPQRASTEHCNWASGTKLSRNGALWLREASPHPLIPFSGGDGSTAVGLKSSWKLINAARMRLIRAPSPV